MHTVLKHSPEQDHLIALLQKLHRQTNLCVETDLGPPVHFPQHNTHVNIDVKEGQYHYSTPNLSKDESLWSSQWCFIRTHHKYPLTFLSMYIWFPFNSAQIHEQHEIFNQRFLELREQKKGVIEELKGQLEKLDKIQAKPKPSLRVPSPYN